MFGEISSGEKTAIWIAFACVAALVLSVALFFVLRSGRKRRIMRSFSPTKKEIHFLLNRAFGRENVLKNVYLPVFDDTGTITSYFYADTIVLLKTGIAVCRFRAETGMIFCGYGAVWHQTARLRSGGTRETDFTNPTLSNNKAVLAVRRLFSFNDLEEPPIVGFVIFTAKSVSFQKPIENVYKLETGIRSIKALKRGTKLEGTPQDDFREIICHYAVKKRVAERYNVEGKD